MFPNFIKITNRQKCVQDGKVFKKGEQ